MPRFGDNPVASTEASAPRFGNNPVAGKEKDLRLLEEIGNGLLEGLPPAARAAGGLIGGAAGGMGGAAAGLLGGPAAPATVPAGATAGGVAGSILLAEAFGQAADIFVDYVKGRRMKNGLERGQEAVVNMATDAAMLGLGAGSSKAVRTATRMTARPMLRNSRAVDIANDLKVAGISPEGATFLMMKPGGQWVAQMERHLPGSAAVWQDAIQSTQNGIMKYADEVAQSARGLKATGSVVEPFRAGEVIQEGVSNYATRSAQEADNLYQAVKGLDQQTVSLAPLKTAAKELAEEAQRGLRNPEADDLIAQVLAKPDQVDFLTARTLRSHLASKARDMGEKKAARSFAKRLVSAADETVESAAKNLDPQALDDFRKANAFYKDRATRLTRLHKVRNGEDGIDAWNKATGGTNRDPSKLVELKKALTSDEWGEYVSARIRDMGQEGRRSGDALQREFNPVSFWSNYRDLVPDVKDAMFGRQTPLRQSLDRLARIGGAIEQTRFMSNPPNTAPSLIGLAFGAGNVAGAGAAATVALSGHPFVGAMMIAGQVGTGVMAGGTLHGSAKLLTNPTFANWLGDGLLIAPTNTKGLAAHLSRLAGFAKQDPGIRDALNGYLEGLSEFGARKAIAQMMSGEGDSPANKSRQPVSARFADAATDYSDQRAVLQRLPEPEQERWRKSMRNEASVMRFFQRANRDVEQINQRLADLDKARDPSAARRERGHLERVRAKLMNEALDFQSGVYGG